MPFFDEIAERTGQMINFTSVATGDRVSFPAFITSYSDDFSVSWGGSTIFGRIDPIKSYQSTGRRISAAFDILGKDEATALKNFKDYSKLIQMMYPVFSDPVGPNPKARTIKAPPLLRIKYANYIRSEANEAGLLGCIQGVTFSPKFESGHFFSEEGEMIPLIYSVTLVFEPLHETPIGFDTNGFFLSEEFPYNQENATVAERFSAADPLSGDSDN